MFPFRSIDNLFQFRNASQLEEERKAKKEKMKRLEFIEHTFEASFFFNILYLYCFYKMVPKYELKYLSQIINIYPLGRNDKFISRFAR